MALTKADLDAILDAVLPRLTQCVDAAFCDAEASIRGEVVKEVQAVLDSSLGAAVQAHIESEVRKRVRVHLKVER